MKCAAYMRKGHWTPELNDYETISNQWDVLKAYAKDNGLEIVEKYWDIGVSAHDMSRPGLQELIAGYSAGKFDRVLVVDMSRLSRKPMEFPFPVVTVNGTPPEAQPFLEQYMNPNKNE